MDIVLNSRHCELTDRFREHVEEKLARLEKHDHRAIRAQVEGEAAPNPRQPDRAAAAGRAARVALAVFSEGRVVRAGAAADGKRSGLDLALDKMAGQLRGAA